MAIKPQPGPRDVLLTTRFCLLKVPQPSSLYHSLRTIKSMGDISQPNIVDCVRVSHATSLVYPVGSVKAPLNSSTQFARQYVKDAVKI